MQWTLYGYFWGVPSDYSHIAAVSIAFLRDLLHWGGIRIRSSDTYINSRPDSKDAVRQFIEKSGSTYLVWKAGKYKDELAGWHCSWCCSVECIAIKLVSAQNGDFPRWGDYPEKRNVTYIKNLVRSGLWFDDKSTHVKRTPSDHLFAPVGVFNNTERFRHILFNPYILVS